MSTETKLPLGLKQEFANGLIAFLRTKTHVPNRMRIRWNDSHYQYKVVSWVTKVIDVPSTAAIHRLNPRHPPERADQKTLTIEMLKRRVQSCIVQLGRCNYSTAATWLDEYIEQRKEIWGEFVMLLW